ncbi:F0F1 ATP synthase subunit delta [Jatrophihabitans sp. YIM 134969]
MPVLNAASRESTARVLEDLDATAGGLSDRPAVAGGLFGIVGVLSGNAGLRRTLAEASVESDDRAGLLRRLFDGRVPAATLDIASDVVGKRWSNPWDLVDALEGAGNQLLLIEAEQARHLEAVEDQLFRFGRIVAGDSGLRGALDDRTVPGEQRATLATRLLDGRADPVTVALVTQGVRSTSHPSVELAVDDLLELTASRRQRSIASVTSAVALSDAQTERLAATLSRLYGRDIAVRVDVDPRIRGGLVVRLGDEIIDGSVATRLAAARSRLGA